MSVVDQVHITEVRMIADRFGGDGSVLFAGNGVDNPSAVEFSIFENITKPYLTANLVIQDDNNLYSRLNIQGTEKIVLSFRPVIGQGLDTAGSTEVRKTFNIVNVQRAVKTNDYNQIISLSLIEDVGFHDLITIFSRSYVGKGEDIISKIVLDNLKRSVTNKGKESRNKSFRYIVPYISPFAACKTILSKMVTENGAPYFFYSTVASDNLIINDLESIFTSSSFNNNDPFVYSSGQVNSKEAKFNDEIHNIEALQTTSTDDTLKLVQTAGLASTYDYINIWKGQTISNDVFVPDYIEKLLPSLGDLTHIRWDTKFKPGGEGDQRTLDRFPVSSLSEAFSSPFPLDESNVGFNEEAEIGDYNLKVAKNGILQHLTSNVLNIQVPGFLFTTANPNTTIGNCIDLKVYKNDTYEITSDPYDPRRSGKFCILSKRHLINITNETLSVSMEVGRVTDPELI